jgi:TfoX/Sxy family transcriptional regulator of competence genes
VTTSEQTIEYIEDQLSGLNLRTARMFGEYCLYVDGKVVGFVCDDTLFIKPSPVDKSLLVGTEPGHPYPGSKEYHSVPGDLLENAEWVREAVQATADALPAPKPKKTRKEPT